MFGEFGREKADPAAYVFYVKISVKKSKNFINKKSVILR